MKVNILVGVRFQAAQLAKILIEFGHDLQVYSSSPAKKWKLGEAHGSRVHFVPLVANIFSAITKIQLPYALREASVILFDYLSSLFMVKSDIVHAWSSFCLRSITKAKKRGAIVYIEKSCPHPHFQNKLLDEEAAFLGVERKVYSESFTRRTIKEFEVADKIIVCSNYTLNSFLENGFERDQLYNIALDANFYPKSTHLKDFNKESLVVGFVGGSVLRKGVYYLLKAWKQLALKDGKLLLKASKAGLQEVPKIWELIEGDPSIEIVGYVDDMEDFYRRCDLFVLPSIDEGFGMVVFEAMACSLPVIITKNVGSGDFVEHGEQGYIIDIRDPDAIAKKVGKLHQNRDLMSSMSQKALQTFKNYQKRDDNYKNRVKKLYSIGLNQ